LEEEETPISMEAGEAMAAAGEATVVAMAVVEAAAMAEVVTSPDQIGSSLTLRLGPDMTTPCKAIRRALKCS
jgi:hypothetical protein